MSSHRSSGRTKTWRTCAKLPCHESLRDRGTDRCLQAILQSLLHAVADSFAQPFLDPFSNPLFDGLRESLANDRDQPLRVAAAGLHLREAHLNRLRQSLANGLVYPLANFFLQTLPAGGGDPLAQLWLERFADFRAD